MNRRALLPGLALLALAGVAPAQEPPALPAPPPAEVFFSQPALAQPRLSPSGRYVAVLVRGAASRNTLAVVDLEQPGSPQAVARFTDADIRQVHWVGDERLVFDVVDLQVGSGNARFTPGLFSVARDGSGLRELVRLGRDFVVQPAVAINDRRLAYNHELLVVPQDGSGEVIVGELLNLGRGNTVSVLPKRLNVSNGRVRSILGTDVPRDVQRWLFDAQGEPRVAVSRADGRQRVHARLPGAEGWKLLLEVDALSVPWSPHAVDAAGTLYVTAARGAGGTTVLTRFDPATGRPQPQPMVVVEGFDFAGQMVTEFDGGRLLGVRVNSDAETTVWLDDRLKAAQTWVDERLPGRINRIACRRCDGDDRVLLVESYADRDPGTLWTQRGREGRLELLGRVRPAVDPTHMAALDFTRFTARDGRRIPVWFTVPATPAPAGGLRPAIVLVHGGPWVRGGHWRWDPMAQFLASRGYVVIEPEFRGSTGYGAQHFRAGWRQWGRAMQDDVADAVQWAVGQKLADPGRVCIAGASYGGYATLMGLVRDPLMYRCGAAWVAVTEPQRLLERGWWWRDDVSDEARRHGLPTMLADPVADAELLKTISPVQQAARIRAPVLLAFGGLDERVPLVHGNEMRAALRAAGQEPEWVVYEDEGHGWLKPENRLDFARRLEAFFAKHLLAR